MENFKQRAPESFSAQRVLSQQREAIKFFEASLFPISNNRNECFDSFQDWMSQSFPQNSISSIAPRPMNVADRFMCRLAV